MQYNFDEIVNRRGTTCVKWDKSIMDFGESTIPMWVADMDFPAPIEVQEAIKKRSEQSIFGYTYIKDEVYDVVVNSIKENHGWDIKKEWIVFLPGVVDGIATSLNVFTEKTDRVVIQPPVYPRFYSVANAMGRNLLLNNLKLTDEGYKMDLQNLQSTVETEKPKLMILCNPHNPIGRVWTKEELKTLGEICVKNTVIIISDEIHSDIVYKGFKHIPVASICKEFEQNSITLMAPSKTFNVAGLGQAFAIIPNKDLRNTFTTGREGYSWGNIFGITSFEVCYKYGERYKEELLEYLEVNIKFVEKYLKEQLPNIKMHKPEGTYLLWLDMRKLGMNKTQLDDFIRDKVKVRFNEGYSFGKVGEGFMRMNIGCPRIYIKEALDRLKNAVNNLNIK
ncbi:MalY/PatB family protein [Clostridium algidicarnis]|uniref:MalY/PatB family protein n=1 Tax=Clostridium algidicarnis TaxID=37659 RepID=UPI001C0CF2C2|nr:MalY/PatB family protein [Clostridium algidicarnis]MBU3195100.1 pyridoxal phosphate-dependent aminotransferase [Clostridium algidicarnis]MBU3208056.1 pyridoxal phosphate-dependent aminotransferase [Clostridium algidicarnis]MBU3229112.1 pyridoxal phosphate-dependent aminotransferase [Clostridium algidicarnis]MBU3251867.1 pyridoxal phosphate-dependent aminotransferase [Clostridium algidicarnis]